MARKLSAKQIAAGFGGKRRKASRRRGKARRSKSVRRVTATRKVRHMARKHHNRSNKRFKIPVIGTLLGIGMVEAAAPGSISSLVKGDLKGAGGALGAALQQPRAAAGRALPFGLGLGAYGLAKRYMRPGANIGPIRIEV